jgi:non-ribosomal peptide synthase protein (TIGR01720 family)
VEPGDVEAVLLQHPLVRHAAVVARTERVAERRLAAYLAVSDHRPADAETVATLRRFVAERLPAPMVPSSFVLLATLPLTVNGKVDRQALARLTGAETGAGTVRRPPETVIERLLAEIWTDILHVDAPSVDDNFFALGGDSLSSIQVVAQARRHGIVLRPQDLFEHQTLGCLAAIAAIAAAPRADQGLVIGPVPLTPIQRLFFAADLPDLHHYNLAVLLEVPSLDSRLVGIAVEHLLRHHDALRLRFRRDGAEWRQVVTGLDGAVPFTTVDLSGRTDDDLGSIIETLGNEWQRSLDLAAGPVFRVVHLDRGPERSGRLLLVGHHLVCDVVSWPVLLDDLGAIYHQLAEDEPIALPAKTSAFRAWAERLVEYGRRSACVDELAFWRRECVEPGTRLALDAPEHAPAVADIAHVRRVLGRSERARVGALAAAGGIAIEGVLLTALVTAVTALAGGDALLVYLERHGRDALFADLDLSRTVGWFTAVFPVRVQVAASRRPEDTLTLVARHLREIPDGGIGFGVLRSGLSGPETAAELRALPRPEMSFNYLGRTDPPEGRWPLAPESAGREVGLRGTRPTILDVTAHVRGAELHVDWAYDATLHHRATIQDLAERFLGALRELIAAAGPGVTL